MTQNATEQTSPNLDPQPDNQARQKKTARRAFLYALLFSICFIHAPLIYFFLTVETTGRSSLQTPPKERVVMVDLKDMPGLPQRIVDLAKPKVEKVPEKASAQSLYNSSVEQETVAKNFSKSNTPIGQQPRPQPQPAPSQQTNNSTLTPQQKLLALRDLQKEEENKKYSDRYQETPNQALENLRANIGSPTGGNSDDYLPDYKVGDRTYLNTLANPSIGFYVELRHKFRFAWNPIPVLRKNYPNIISKGQMVSVWGVSVNNEGQLAALTLLRGSGLDVYDNEAKRAITSSAPFSKPPATLLAKDGMLHMAWTFVVYL